MIFADYLPEAEKKDFYEMDIASGGITRGFMAKHCHLYFKIEDKIRRHLQCCFTGAQGEAGCSDRCGIRGGSAIYRTKTDRRYHRAGASGI